MKSAHRHQLETNALAHRLEVFIERFRPYSTQILGVLAAVGVLILIWIYISNSSVMNRSKSWDTFNQTIAATQPNIEEIHRTAQDFPGTKMKDMADVTWADAQVWLASRNYLNNRPMATEALGRAMSAYESVLQSSNDDRLIGRAHLGLARVYEMQNHLDKARDEYRLVSGAYADYAKQQVERLEKPETQETYAWLATAQPPRPQMPVGPGTPGQRPEFAQGEINLPGATGSDAGKTEGAKGAAETFEDLLKSMKNETKSGETPDRYQPAQAPAKDSSTKPPGETSSAPESKGTTPPPAPSTTEEKKPAETSAKTDTPPKAETPAKTETPAK